MQAMQSSTASGKMRSAERFAALGYIGQLLGVNADETPRRRRPDGVEEENGGGGGLGGEAAEMLAVLHLNATLLGDDCFSREEGLRLRAEFRELIDDSWGLVERALECSEASRRGREGARSDIFLKPMPCRGAIEGEPGPVECAPAGRRPPGRQGRYLEESSAGWIAC